MKKLKISADYTAENSKKQHFAKTKNCLISRNFAVRDSKESKLGIRTLLGSLSVLYWSLSRVPEMIGEEDGVGLTMTDQLLADRAVVGHLQLVIVAAVLHPKHIKQKDITVYSNMSVLDWRRR
jgi:hypothetical protein